MSQQKTIHTTLTGASPTYTVEPGAIAFSVLALSGTATITEKLNDTVLGIDSTGTNYGYNYDPMLPSRWGEFEVAPSGDILVVEVR